VTAHTSALGAAGMQSVLSEFDISVLPSHAAQASLPFMAPSNPSGQRHCVLPLFASLLPWQPVQEELPTVADTASPWHARQTPLLLSCPAEQAAHEVSPIARPCPSEQTMQAALPLSEGFCTCPAGHSVHWLFVALKYW
jgi:hypothetical protein